jgi:hypothetical protein
MAFKMKGSEFYGKLKLNRNMDNTSLEDGRPGNSAFTKRGSFIFDVDEQVDKRATYEDTKKAELEGKRVTYTNRERDRRVAEKDMPNIGHETGDKKNPKAHAERLKDPEYKKDQDIDRAAQTRLEKKEARKRNEKVHKMYDVKDKSPRGSEEARRKELLHEAESKGADVSKRAVTEKKVTVGDKDATNVHTARSYSGANTPEAREKRIERGIAARTKDKGWTKAKTKKSAKREAADKARYEDV